MSMPTDNHKFNFFKQQTDQLYRQAVKNLGKEQTDKLFGEKTVIMANSATEKRVDWSRYKNFSEDEFMCPCGCQKVDMNPELIEKLQSIRDFIGRPVKVLSGFRCKKHNEEVGGEERSAHLVGDAADISIYSSNHRFVFLKAALDLDFVRLGIYPTFIHVDVNRENPQEVAWLG